jgi:hypothetical protein
MKWAPAAFFGVLSLMGCEVNKTDQILTVKKLQEIEIGSVVKLSDLVHEKDGSACVLHPYQDKISDKQHESLLINKYLQDIKYQADESHWSLVTSNVGSNSIYLFKRSKSLDIFSAQSLKSSVTENLPANFEMADCTSLDRAAFFKISISDRIYLMFGSIK